MTVLLAVTDWGWPETATTGIVLVTCCFGMWVFLKWIELE